MNIAEAQVFGLKWNIPFYTYRLPQKEEVVWGAQLQGEVEKFEGMEYAAKTEGFVVVPFRETVQVPSLFIRQDVTFVNESEDEKLAVYMENCQRKPVSVISAVPGISREEYHRQVTAMIAALKQKVVSKMVLSRSILVECDAFELVPEWFNQLTEKYPDAFVFLVSVPGVMTWMGATPEIFLQQEENGAETMALAGTRPLGNEELWGGKELEEQQIVSEYIASLLRENGEWKVTGPFSQPAGNVEHLCTLFTSEKQLTFDRIDRIRTKLHPTPAVGGFPTREAVELLGEIEGYERRYYAGYLGPIGQLLTFHWFVNLRCMEVFPRAVCLYVGGGITALSDPYKEWEETELKSRTLLDVIC